MAKIKLDALKFEKIVKDYAHIRKVTIPDAVVANARLLCVELARRTQPFGADDKAKLTGEKAINRDLKGGKKRAGIFAKADFTDDMGFEWYATGPNVRLFITKDGRVYGTDKSFYEPDASHDRMRAWHKSKYVNGKMSSAGSRSRDIGRWKFIEKLMVSKSTLDTYVDSQIKKVGWAKAGWAACARDLRKVVKGSMTRGIPPWVTRHDSYQGDVIDRTNDPKNPTVTLTNSTPYISQILPYSEQLNALNIVSNKMRKQMARILKKRETTIE
jgi:hypothetical protein